MTETELEEMCYCHVFNERFVCVNCGMTLQEFFYTETPKVCKGEKNEKAN